MFGMSGSFYNESKYLLVDSVFKKNNVGVNKIINEKNYSGYSHK